MSNLPSTAWLTGRPWVALLAAAGLLIVVGVGVYCRCRLLAWRHQRLVTGARWLTIAAPPEVSAEAAAVFWTTVVGVLTPSVWRRRVYGYPHVGWEYTWTGRTLTIRVWVPGTVPPGAVEAAVRAAWPAATLTTADAAAPIPALVGEQVGGLAFLCRPVPPGISRLVLVQPETPTEPRCPDARLGFCRPHGTVGSPIGLVHR